MNPRTWLWVGLAKASGIEFAKYIYNNLNNIKTEYPISYKVGLKWMNFWTDIVYSLYGILKGKYSIKEIINSYKGKVVNELFSFKDPLPFFMMLLLLPYFKLKR